MSYLMCTRNGELHDKKFLQYIDSHCRRTTKITGWEDLKRKKCDVNPMLSAEKKSTFVSSQNNLLFFFFSFSVNIYLFF